MKIIRVLSLRGGGIKGITTAQILSNFESIHGPTRGNFDLIAGTSTGGIIAIALGLGIPAKDLVKFYMEDGPKIFTRRLISYFGINFARYKSAPLSEALERRFGWQALSSCRTNVLIPTTDLETKATILWKSWQSEGDDISCIDAALATSAAPSYFPPLAKFDYRASAATSKGRTRYLVDGGCGSNNPCDIAACEARKLYGSEPIRIALVDIACMTKAIPFNTRRHRWGLMDYAKDMPDLLLSPGEDKSEYLCRSAGDVLYLKLQPPLGKSSGRMDDASPGNLAEMVNACALVSTDYAMQMVKHINIGKEVSS